LLVGAENEELAVVGGLTASEFEDEDIRDCNTDDVAVVDVDENDGAAGRLWLRLSPEIGEGVRLR
jgi:hypothetical protein